MTIYVHFLFKKTRGIIDKFAELVYYYLTSLPS